MVRLMLSNGNIVKKRFNSADEARRWFKFNKSKYDRNTASIISEAKYNKYYKK